MVGLQQRLLSSIEAFARSLKVHRDTLARHQEKALVNYGFFFQATDRDVNLLVASPGTDDEQGEWTGEEIEAEESAQITAATAVTEADQSYAGSLWQREQVIT